MRDISTSKGRKVRALLRRFFEDREGDLDEARTFEATAPDGTVHIFELPALIDLIQVAADSEQENIWRVIQRLDVTNAPHSAFYDYFQFLADAYARTTQCGREQAGPAR